MAKLANVCNVFDLDVLQKLILWYIYLQGKQKCHFFVKGIFKWGLLITYTA